MTHDETWWHFCEVSEVSGRALRVQLERHLAVGDVCRLQLKSCKGDLVLVVPLSGKAIDPRWLPVVETLARQHDTLTLRIARVGHETGAAPREATPASVG